MRGFPYYFLSILGFFLVGSLGVRWAYSESQTSAETKKPERDALATILLSKRSSKTLVRDTNVDEACASLWQSVRSLDLQRINEEVFRGCILLPTNQGCQKLPVEISSVHNDYLTKCAPFSSVRSEKLPEPELHEQAHACFLSLLAYRSALGNWMIKDTPLSEIQDTSLLGDKLLHTMLGSMHGEEVSPGAIREIADRVNELNPNIYSTSKISTIGRLMDALSAPSDESWSQAKRALEGLERFQENDPELKMLSLWVRTEGVQPGKLREEAKRLIDEDPTSGLGYFYMAFAETAQGNRERVESLFLNAVNADPENPTFVKALESYRAKRPVLPPFQLEFSAGIADLMERG